MQDDKRPVPVNVPSHVPYKQALTCSFIIWCNISSLSFTCDQDQALIYFTSGGRHRGKGNKDLIQTLLKNVRAL